MAEILPIARKTIQPINQPFLNLQCVILDFTELDAFRNVVNIAQRTEIAIPHPVFVSTGVKAVGKEPNV